MAPLLVPARRYALRRAACGCTTTDSTASASYKVKVVYTGDMFQVKVRLSANDSIEVHPFLLKPRDMTPLEFDIPREATRDGTLTLTWTAEPGRGGNGRGCQVAEVWLIRK